MPAVTPDTARRLLELTLEFAHSTEVHENPRWAGLPGEPIGRTPDEIAAEYAALLAPVR